VETIPLLKLPDTKPLFVKVIVSAKAGAANSVSNIMHTKMRDFIDLLLKTMFGRKTRSVTASQGRISCIGAAGNHAILNSRLRTNFCTNSKGLYVVATKCISNLSTRRGEGNGYRRRLHHEGISGDEAT
jgi:hypothetical protein